MSLTPEQQKELARFPAPLVALVQAELVAGNAIEAIEHGFPAAPCGASILLAKAVQAERRQSTGGIVFYARNNSRYAGEFTTAERHFFVLEPPLPEPPPPDMDAIRRAHEPHPAQTAQIAGRVAGSGEHASGSAALAPVSPAAPSPKPSEIQRQVDAGASLTRRALVSIESKTGVKRILHFQDQRPPHEVQFSLERTLMVVFAGAMEQGRLCWLALANVNGARYVFELRFEAALPRMNHYSLRVEGSWAEQPTNSHDYFRKTSDSWFSLWTRDLMPATPSAPDDNAGEHYAKLAEAALRAEAHLDSVTAIQQAILAELKRGACFATSHKEGGTSISWRGDRFVRSDYGYEPAVKEFRNEADFLSMLKGFCHFEVTRNAGTGQLPELDLWRLIRRCLRKP